MLPVGNSFNSSDPLTLLLIAAQGMTEAQGSDRRNKFGRELGEADWATEMQRITMEVERNRNEDR